MTKTTRLVQRDMENTSQFGQPFADVIYISNSHLPWTNMDMLSKCMVAHCCCCCCFNWYMLFTYILCWIVLRWIPNKDFVCPNRVGSVWPTFHLSTEVHIFFLSFTQLPTENIKAHVYSIDVLNFCTLACKSQTRGCFKINAHRPPFGQIKRDVSVTTHIASADVALPCPEPENPFSIWRCIRGWYNNKSNALQ